MIVAGIGTRDLHDDDRALLESWGILFAKRGIDLRTGNATGSDHALAEGIRRGGGHPTLLLPWAGYNEDQIHSDDIVEVPSLTSTEMELCIAAHPKWHVLKQGARKMMMRNVAILRGVSAVYALPSDNIGGGGTGQGMRAAKLMGLPVFDLTTESGWNAGKAWLQSISISDPIG